MNQFARHTLSTIVVTTAAAVALGACSRDERQEVRTETKEATSTAGNMIDNAALTTKVKAALLADEMVKGTQINVDSSNGVVTLNGTVESAAHMQRAQEITTGVTGVTRVQNNLTASAAGTTGATMTTPSSTLTPQSGMTATPGGSTTPPSSSNTPAPSSSMSVPDMTTAAGSPGRTSSRMVGDSRSMTPDMIREVQQQLTDRGYKPGPVDGVMGPSTTSALRDFKRKEGMAGTDLDQDTLSALGVQAAIKP